MAARSSMRTQARPGTGVPMATRGRPSRLTRVDLVDLHRHVEGDHAVDPFPQHVLRQRKALVEAVVLEVEQDDVVSLGPR